MHTLSKINHWCVSLFNETGWLTKERIYVLRENPLSDKKTSSFLFSSKTLNIAHSVPFYEAYSHFFYFGHNTRRAETSREHLEYNDNLNVSCMRISRMHLYGPLNDGAHANVACILRLGRNASRVRLYGRDLCLPDTDTGIISDKRTHYYKNGDMRIHLIYFYK